MGTSGTVEYQIRTKNFTSMIMLKESRIHEQVFGRVPLLGYLLFPRKCLIKILYISHTDMDACLCLHFFAALVISEKNNNYTER